MIFLIVTRYFSSIINPKKSGMLNKNVVKTTALKTNFDPYLLGKTFNTINTIVIGYKNITDFSMKHELHRLFHEEVAIHAQRQAEISHVIYDRKVFGFSDCAYFFFYYKDGIEDERKNSSKQNCLRCCKR